MNRGFSLVEALIGTLIIAVVGGGIFLCFSQGQETFEAQHDLRESGQQARIAMDQLIRSIRQAGNDPFDFLKAGGIPPVQIMGTNQIQINSDITGSVASTTGNPKESTGDPDGALSSLYEQIVFRYDSIGRQLFVDVGDGEQLLVDNVTTFDLNYFDLSGNPTTDSNALARVNIRMIVGTGRPDRQTGENRDLTLDSNVFLRAKSYDPFSASP
ncbi:MAG: PilW family protein [Acidobacteriota bacterium]